MMGLGGGREWLEGEGREEGEADYGNGTLLKGMNGSPPPPPFIDNDEHSMRVYI